MKADDFEVKVAVSTTGRRAWAFPLVSVGVASNVARFFANSCATNVLCHK